MSFSLAELFLMGCVGALGGVCVHLRSKLMFQQVMMMQMVEGFADKKVEAYRDKNGRAQMRTTNNVRGEA